MTVNVGYNMKSNLRVIMEMVNGEEKKPVSIDDKRNFVQELKNFSAMGESVYGKGNLQELCERVKNIVDKAQAIALEEGDWFNEVAHKRHFKRLEEDYKLFEETAREISQLQERLSMAYENIGSGLNRYYEVQ
jgi:hypothetical protein